MDTAIRWVIFPFKWAMIPSNGVGYLAVQFGMPLNTDSDTAIPVCLFKFSVPFPVAGKYAALACSWPTCVKDNFSLMSLHSVSIH